MRLTTEGVVGSVKDQVPRRPSAALAGAEKRTREVHRVRCSTGTAADMHGGATSEVEGSSEIKQDGELLLPMKFQIDAQDRKEPIIRPDLDDKSNDEKVKDLSTERISTYHMSKRHVDECRPQLRKHDHLVRLRSLNYVEHKGNHVRR